MKYLRILLLPLIFLSCLGNKNETHLPFIDRLQENENYRINISSLGDFTGGKHEAVIIITRTNDAYYATFKNNRKTLNRAEIKYIREFELKLIKMESEGCTTVDTYLLTYNNEHIQITDGSCEWEGFTLLFKNLFPTYKN